MFLPNRDGHGAWVNSAALRRAGIDRDTPDPADGRIERDADGDPTGTLHEGAMTLVNRLLPETATAELTEALLRGQQYLHSFGITAWQDAIVGAYGDADDPGPAYLRAAADRHAHGSGRRRDLVGPRARARADPVAPGAARALPRRPLRRDEREDHAGRRRRELHGRDARAVLRRARPLHRQLGDLVRRRRRS